MRNKFTAEGGRLYTQALFYEMATDTSVVLYSLKDYDVSKDGKTYPSLKRLYLEMEDTTEYEFATTYFDSYNHWCRITENRQIKPFIEEMRQELEMKLRARAVKRMVQLAEDGNYQAVKWLADRGWDNRGAGRPSAVEKQKAMAITQRVADEFSEDILRLRVV